VGLSNEDKARATGLDMLTCYERIRFWLLEHGQECVVDATPEGKRRFLGLVTRTLPWAETSAADRRYVMHEVIAGGLEYAYHETDSHGIKMAAYAFTGLESDGAPWGSAALSASMRQAKLNLQR
jgi:hypothetical protein